MTGTAPTDEDRAAELLRRQLAEWSMLSRSAQHGAEARRDDQASTLMLLARRVGLGTEDCRDLQHDLRTQRRTVEAALADADNCLNRLDRTADLLSRLVDAARRLLDTTDRQLAARHLERVRARQADHELAVLRGRDPHAVADLDAAGEGRNAVGRLETLRGQIAAIETEATQIRHLLLAAADDARTTQHRGLALLGQQTGLADQLETARDAIGELARRADAGRLALATAAPGLAAARRHYESAQAEVARRRGVPFPPPSGPPVSPSGSAGGT